MTETGHLRFDLPWRIDWSVPGEAARAGEACARVREASPMVVVLTASSAGQLLPLGLPWPGTAAVWVNPGWRDALSRSKGGPSMPPGVTRVELPVERLSSAREACAAWGGEGGPALPGRSLRWLPRPETLPDLPGLLALARGQGWGVTLPAPPAEDAASLGRWPTEILPPSAWEAARRDAAALGASLAVHDFHLSRALMIEGPEPAGCEAGDALAFVDEDGAVYPCRSLKVRLGSLQEGLEAVWGSPARKRLRADLASRAAACGGCPHLSRCRGGCRGLAFHAAGRFDARDPRCPETCP